MNNNHQNIYTLYFNQTIYNQLNNLVYLQTKYYHMKNIIYIPLIYSMPVVGLEFISGFFIL